MLFALIRKEAYEHVWKLFILFVILLLSMMATEALASPLNFPDYGRGVWMLLAFFAPIWIAAFTITAEKAGGTDSTLFALPTSRLLIYFVKTVMGLLAFMIPLCCTLALEMKSFPRNEFQNYVQALLAGAGLYFLVLLIAFHVRREGLAVMIGILVLLSCAIYGAWVGTRFNIREQVNGGLDIRHPFIFFLLNLVNPLGRVINAPINFEYGPEWAESIVVQIGVIATYWLLAAWRYDRLSAVVAKANSRPSHAVFQVASFPKAAARYPLLWKESREQLPIILLTAIVGVLMALLYAYIDFPGAGYRPNPRLTYLRDSLQMFFIMGGYISIIVATILGLSSISSDMNGSLSGFWRATSIPAARLFWTKLLFAYIGLVVLISAFEIPYIIIDPILQARGVVSRNVFESSPWETFRTQLLMLPLTLSVATFVASVVRRTTYAAVITICTIGVISLIPINQHFDTVSDVINHHLKDPTLASFYPVVVVLVLALIVGFALLARTFFCRTAMSTST